MVVFFDFSVFQALASQILTLGTYAIPLPFRDVD
jgi:hypothetical protein